MSYDSVIFREKMVCTIEFIMKLNFNKYGYLTPVNLLAITYYNNNNKNNAL
jgi:hypothetical protein